MVIKLSDITDDSITVGTEAHLIEAGDGRSCKLRLHLKYNHPSINLYFLECPHGQIYQFDIHAYIINSESMDIETFISGVLKHAIQSGNTGWLNWTAKILQPHIDDLLADIDREALNTKPGAG